jgi:hypothetical protein
LSAVATPAFDRVADMLGETENVADVPLVDMASEVIGSLDFGPRANPNRGNSV